MPNMGAYKPKNAYEYNNTYYDDKTSDYGHYEPEITGKRYGRDGSMASIKEMRWVEDNGQFSGPDATETQASLPAAPAPSAEVQLSVRAAEANAATEAYEKNLLTRQGDATILNDSSPVQDYKNAYQNNLTEELKAKAPTTLANRKAEIEMADKQAQDINASYALNLGDGMYK